MTLQEDVPIFLWEVIMLLPNKTMKKDVSERLLLGDMGMKCLKNDGPSPKVVGHDLDSARVWI